MKEAGCRATVGYESGDPQILKNIKKGASIERILLAQSPENSPAQARLPGDHRFRDAKMRP